MRKIRGGEGGGGIPSYMTGEKEVDQKLRRNLSEWKPSEGLLSGRGLISSGNFQDNKNF